MIVHGVVQGSGKQLRIVGSWKIWSPINWNGARNSADERRPIDAGRPDLREAGGRAESKNHGGRDECCRRAPDENVAAYDVYLRGRQALRGQQDPKNIQAAIDQFEQAIKMDNGFALAYTGLSDARC